jgi:hypothetical protein
MGNMRRGHSTFNIRTRRLFCESKIEEAPGDRATTGRLISRAEMAFYDVHFRGGLLQRLGFRYFLLDKVGN